MWKRLLAIPLLALAMALAGCGSSGSGGGNGGPGDPPGPGPSDPIDPTDPDPVDDPDEYFKALNCEEYGPVEGPLDAVQEPLVGELGGALADIPEIGESAAALVMGISSFLDVVDALAASGAVLFAEQDPESAADAMDGASLAMQCGAKALYESYTESPLAEYLPDEVDALVLELVALATFFDGMDMDSPASSLEALTARLNNVADSLADIVAWAPTQFWDELPEELDGFRGLLEIPAELLRNVGDVIATTGALDGQGVADSITNVVADLLGAFGGMDFAPEELNDALEMVQEQLAGGLAMVLVPLFDALAQALMADVGGEQFAFDTIAEMSLGGFTGGGFDGSLPIPLEDLLAGVPVLGDLLGMLLAAGGGDFDFTNPAAGAELLLGLLTGGVDGGPADLLGGLTEAFGLLQGLAPDFAPGGGVGDLGELLSLLEDNPIGELLGMLTGGLGGAGAPDFASGDLSGALAAVFGEFADVGAGCVIPLPILCSIVNLVVDIISGLWDALGATDNPLQALVSGVVGDFLDGQGNIPISQLTDALEDLLGGLGSFGN